MSTRIPFRTKADHRSPEWIDAATYFVTICCEDRGLNQLCGEFGLQILESIAAYHQKQRWYCEYAVLMPDHVHFLVSFIGEESYHRTVGDWKHWQTTQHGIRWQENFFEHRLRSDESLDLKARYMMNNPVRAGLVDDERKWPFSWQPG
jgi:putative transposase